MAAGLWLGVEDGEAQAQAAQGETSGEAGLPTWR